MSRHLAEIFLIITTNLKVRYRQTLIGFLWVISNPVLLYFVQAVIFSRILKRDDNNYYFYLLSGLMPWFYLSQTAEMGCNYILGNGRLLKNLRIHPFKLILGLAGENYLNFLCASSVIFVCLQMKFGLQWSEVMQYLLCSLFLVLLVTLITFISSLLHIVFKDTKYILHFGFTVLYFLTPTFFYTSELPETLQQLIRLNPVYWMISLFRLSADSSQLTVIVVNLVFLGVLSVTSFGLWKGLKARIYLKL